MKDDLITGMAYWVWMGLDDIKDRVIVVTVITPVEVMLVLHMACDGINLQTMTGRAVVVFSQVILILLWSEDLLAKLTRSETVDLGAMVFKTIQCKSATTYVAHCLPMLFEMLIQVSEKHDHVADVALLKVRWKGTNNRKERRFAREECSRELVEVTLRYELRLAIQETVLGLLQVVNFRPKIMCNSIL